MSRKQQETLDALSGDRWGASRWGEMPPGPPPPMVPLARYRRLRALLVAAVAAAALSGALTLATSWRLMGARAELAAARSPCALMANTLGLVDSALKLARDAEDLAARTGPLAIALGPVVGQCTGDAAYATAAAAELAEARSVAAALDVLAGIRERLRTTTLP